MALKKVLIITYYWPPSGGPGVQRWIRFVQHLRSFNWEPILYVPENPSYVLLDKNLQSNIPTDIEVLKHPIIEPNSILEKLSFSSKKEGKLYENQQQKGNRKSLVQKLLWYVRGNFFIPDARFLWIKPSVKYLTKVLSDTDFDLIVSTGPPHSVHLIAKKLQEKFELPWVADFRDPWTSMDYLKEMSLSSRALKKHDAQEREVITSADKIIVVGQTMMNEFKDRYDVESTIIHNGFNEMEETENVQLDAKFTLSHIGSFLKNRNCDDLWNVLATMLKENTDFKNDLCIQLIGRLAPNVESSIEKFGLSNYIDRKGYMPFAETQKYLLASQVLLLPIDRIDNAEFILTGKIFEYLKSRRPILLIGPTHGDAAALVNQTKAGYCCNFDDESAIRQTIEKMYELYKRGENHVRSEGIEKFSGVELTRKMANVFDQLA